VLWYLSQLNTLSHDITSINMCYGEMIILSYPRLSFHTRSLVYFNVNDTVDQWSRGARTFRDDHFSKLIGRRWSLISCMAMKVRKGGSEIQTTVVRSTEKRWSRVRLTLFRWLTTAKCLCLIETGSRTSCLSWIYQVCKCTYKSLLR